jgi:16S rRNA G966 N2-methylase RsmD
MNRLYFGDNLDWLRNRDEFPSESVDLVYLDPPFNSNADYNVLFRETSGEVSQAQFHAGAPVDRHCCHLSRDQPD